ncbi:Glycosyltransferase involved in cell wall bisynthesis [Roseovarius marisflavi]|uniref:Glycosyltransferase involved in cell wall bisynthesis n=1 Tax=Roseovarius marisflavi TaxID=1054996 RepID=A0A1M7BLL0_9RHOB|nr:glycosyltransferase family 2 protein [Roseovarius marisflavi]SHL55756.1 Glycosyltransferase involved in cell wall bisynthesis [Roseovarius marisflavi]
MDHAKPALSVIIPAHNEAGLIGPCLDALLTSDWAGGGLEVIVVANGCTDTTVPEAETRRARTEARGWRMQMLDLAQGSKPGALNAGERAATGQVLAYLDADVEVTPPLLAEIAQALSGPDPAHASGRVIIPPPQTAFSRTYARFYRQVPFFHHGVPGCGFFAMNRAGRARWGEWPGIISDDTFARLNFAPNERIAVKAGYRWPLVEGFGALVKVRRRQDRGVAELAEAYPALLANDDTRPSGRDWIIGAARRAPMAFLAYVTVALAVRTGKGSGEWTRGR